MFFITPNVVPVLISHFCFGHVKYTYFVFWAVMITHFVCLTIYFITRMHPCQSKCHTFCLAAVYVSYSVTSPMFFPLGNHDTNLAILCIFTCVHPPGDYHTCSCCPLQITLLRIHQSLAHHINCHGLS